MLVIIPHWRETHATMKIQPTFQSDALAMLQCCRAVTVISIHEWEKLNENVTSAVKLRLRGPDRWSERVSALGPAVRREAPQARGKRERDRQDCWPLRDPERRPAACLVAAPRCTRGWCWQKTHVYSGIHTMLCLTADYCGWTELTDVLYVVVKCSVCRREASDVSW